MTQVGLTLYQWVQNYYNNTGVVTTSDEQKH